MKTVNVHEIKEKIDQEDYNRAKECPYLLYDKNGGPALWHCCFCDKMPKRRGMPEFCYLVWHGKCFKEEENK